MINGSAVVTCKCSSLDLVYLRYQTNALYVTARELNDLAMGLYEWNMTVKGVWCVFCVIIVNKTV